MLSALIMAFLVSLQPVQEQQTGQRSQPTIWRELVLNGMDTGEPHLMIRVPNNLLDPPKKSPLNAWEFRYLASGYARDSVDTSYKIRMEVFDQFDSGKADMAVRMLLRLWDFNRQRLNLDHATTFYRRTVHVYLAFGGEPGAEQRFMQDPELLDERNAPSKVNTIYVYAITTLDDPLEFARELAHEYGHAILPPLGDGFKEPEQWVNGDVGERIYMMWLLEGMKAGKIGPADVMGASLEKMQTFYDKVVLPDLKRVGTKGPDLKLLKKRNQAAFDEMLGLATYAASIMPAKMFGRAIVLPDSADPESFLKAVLEASSERKDWLMTVPPGLEGQAIWVPLRKGRVEGAKELRREGDWVKIQPTSDKVKVVNSPDDES